jgi:dihydrofolate reductase
MDYPQIEAVVAIAINGVIGRDQDLPWKLKADLKRFRKITMGHALLMGRKTFESIGKPLPGRDTFLLSRNSNLKIEGCRTVQSPEQAIQEVGNKTLFLVGGADVYRQFLPLCRAIHITWVLAEVTGETKLELPSLTQYACVEQEYLPADAVNEWPTKYDKYCKIG